MSKRWKKRELPFSERGFELHWKGDGPPEKQTVTVENYGKWYSLFLVLPSGHVLERAFPDCGNYEQLGSAFYDHVPNPRHVYAWALWNGYNIDSAGLAAMCGAWDDCRMEYAGLDGYEVHPNHLLGKNWRSLVERGMQKNAYKYEDCGRGEA